MTLGSTPCIGGSQAPGGARAAIANQAFCYDPSARPCALEPPRCQVAPGLSRAGAGLLKRQVSLRGHRQLQVSASHGLQPYQNLCRQFFLQSSLQCQMHLSKKTNPPFLCRHCNSLCQGLGCHYNIK